MSLVVQKFGGTSVGTPQKIRTIAERIAETYASGHQLIVVVSAMGHTTDELVELAYKVSKKPKNREMDMLLTAGERISMALLSMALEDLKIQAMSFTGSQTGIITDGNHCRARIKKILGDRVKNAISEHKVAIVAGFQGVSESKEITTLGRGGSDTTAVALAAVLNADICEIYTDVDGIFSADPRIVKKAKLIERIPHDLMVEMAFRGAGVLHYRSVDLAEKYGVKLVVKNSFNESEGTEVVNREAIKGMEEYRVLAVADDVSKIFLKINLMRPTVASAIWEFSSKNHLAAIAPMFYDGQMFFYIEKDVEDEWKKGLEKLTHDGFVKSFEVIRNQVPVSLIGNRFLQDCTSLAEISDALASHDILVTHGVASPLAITVSVAASRKDEAVKILHRKFIENCDCL
ncbi:MAG: aspartate kinase [Bdellovibrio sp.]|nr:aspartate kinase [Bdellovibrio sp.]